jgi:hypothetical protein
VGVEDGGSDMGTVDRLQLRGRQEVEGLGPGYVARVLPHCSGLFDTTDAGIVALNAENEDHQPGLAEE